MKTKLLFLAVIGFVLTSCVPTSYFQIYKTIPSDKITLKENSLVYEDDNCKVLYNLWEDGGNIGFRFYNKTEENIYLNLEESFFILNGISFNYYQNRVFTNSSSAGTSAASTPTASKSIFAINSVGVMTSSSYSVSYDEEKIVCIPSMTSKIITEYSINKSLYRDCDLFKYPSKKEIKTKNFKKSDSPFIFSNRILYTVGKLGNLVKFENNFYVSEITNYPEKEILESKNEEFCGQIGVGLIKYFKNSSPDKFYIKYSKGLDTMNH